MLRQPGFTLAEAAVAVAVVGILAGLALPLALKTLGDARLARARHDLNVIAEAIVNQMKDTGCRPAEAGGPGRSDGRGPALWHSRGRMPNAAQGRAWAQPANTFQALFTMDLSPGPDRELANALFGLGRYDPRARFRYNGPYLSPSVANLTDPWGNAYLILGYNQWGQDTKGPIWVVCTGEGGTVEPGNLEGLPVAGHDRRPPETWNSGGLSARNLVVRVN